MASPQSSAVTALAEAGLRLPTTFRALRHRNYRLWFFGQGILNIGTWMQTMAQLVLVYRLTNSAAALGMVNFVAIMPLALWGGDLVGVWVVHRCAVPQSEGDGVRLGMRAEG